MNYQLSMTWHEKKKRNKNIKLPLHTDEGCALTVCVLCFVPYWIVFEFA